VKGRLENEMRVEMSDQENMTDERRETVCFKDMEKFNERAYYNYLSATG